MPDACHYLRILEIFSTVIFLFIRLYSLCIKMTTVNSFVHRNDRTLEI